MAESATSPGRVPPPTSTEATSSTDTTALPPNPTEPPPAAPTGGAVMGHRALVARERPDGRHDVHHSQWGGADCSLARALATGSWPPDGVDPEPRASGVAWTALLAEHVDPVCHEAVFVRAADGVRAYRTFALGDAPTDPEGLLVGVRWAEPCDDARVRAWTAGARAVARAAGERGELTPPAAATVVERCLRDWAGDRAVLRLP